MAFNGSGVFNRLYDWTDDAAAAVKISSTRMDAEMDGMATGLSSCITKDGQTTITADLPMANFRHTGVGAAAARTDYTRASQTQDSSLVYASAGGTADAITLALSPAITAYAAGQKFHFIAGGTNTGAVTLNVNGVGATAVKKRGGSALVAGDIVSGQTVTVVHDGTDFELEGGNAMLLGTHTIPVLAGSMLSRTTNGAASGLTELATNDVMLSTKDFDQTTSEGVQFYVPMPKSWNEGTVTAQFGWTASAGSAAETVIWSISARAFSDDDALDAAFGSAQTASDALIATSDLHISPVTSAITIAGTPAESDFVIFQITRDISDTLAADAKLIWCKIFLTYDAGTDN